MTVPLGRRARAVLALTCFTVAALLCLASAASAAELLYWDNYSEAGHPPGDSVSFAKADGSGGGALNLGGVELTNPEGMAIDTATGRLFIASSVETEEFEPGKSKVTIPGQIVVANLDGRGASVFSVPGAPVSVPQGIAIDPVTGMVFWANTGVEVGDDSIAWAELDGSAGGTLNTTGAKVEGPSRIAVDPATGRVFWANLGAESSSRIAYANEDNAGGGTLDLTGATPPELIGGFAVDSAAGRIFWSAPLTNSFSYASVSGGGGGDIHPSAPADQPYGLAFDPSLGRLYWGNWGNETERAGAFGFSDLAGVGSGIEIATAPVSGPQDPLILKSPAATEAPGVTRSSSSRGSLSCSTDGWAADSSGGFVHQAPTTYRYQWLGRSGALLPGATAATYTARGAGEYSCRVTAANRAGSAVQTSAPITVKTAKLKLTTKKKAKAKAGKLVTFPVKALNQGDLKSRKARVCVKLAGKAKKALKRPRCRTIGELAGRKKKATKVKLRVKGTAEPGTYKLTFQIEGPPGKAAKAKVVVVG